MMHLAFRAPIERADDPDRGSDAERAETAAFFRELGLGWEMDPERLVDRLSELGRAR